MSDRQPCSTDSRTGSRITSALALFTALGLLAFNLFCFLRVAGRAVRSPYELDYGEGIVWQQMRLMFQGKGYGPIDGFPAIVFHYPPLYHATVQALISTAGIDPLMAGRLISFVAAIVCVLLVAALAWQLRRPRESNAVAAICAVLAGLAILTLTTVESWALLMRVDMMAISLSLAGTWFGIRAITRPSEVYLAAICFVAAFFTKQTAVAAPVAVFATLLLLRPATAWRGIALSVALGVTILGSLALATDGGILRHLFLYNINRFDLRELGQIPALVRIQLLFFAAVAIGLWQALDERLPAYVALPTWKKRREKLADDPADGALLLILIYFAAKTLMLLLAAKSGSNVNYFIEWMLVGAIFAGRAARDIAASAVGGQSHSVSSALRFLAPAALAVSALASGLAAQRAIASPAERQQRLKAFSDLSEAIRAAPKPVISDDMVILLRGGKDVVWESSIFAELASTGMWDEGPFVERIRTHGFSFFITEGDRGDPNFDSRYTPAVASAMEHAYPIECRLAGYTLHFPVEAAGPAPKTPTHCVPLAGLRRP